MLHAETLLCYLLLLLLSSMPLRFNWRIGSRNVKSCQFLVKSSIRRSGGVIRQAWTGIRQHRIRRLSGVRWRHMIEALDAR